MLLEKPPDLQEIPMASKGRGGGGGGGEVDSSAPRKVQDEDHLAIEVPETAHQISSGESSFQSLPFQFQQRV